MIHEPQIPLTHIPWRMLNAADRAIFRCPQHEQTVVVLPVTIQTDGRVIWFTCPCCPMGSTDDGNTEYDAHVLSPTLISTALRCIMRLIAAQRAA